MTAETAVLLDRLEAVAKSNESDTEGYWTLVRVVHLSPTQEVFQRCLEWSSAKDTSLQQLAVDCLAQLGYSADFPFRGKTYPIIAELLSSKEASVLAAALSALGHLSPGPCLPQVSGLACHQDVDVRYSAVHALLGSDAPEAVATLISLSQDEDADVRNWATFGLGSQIDVDAPAIREALFARAADSDGDTRAEALAGLARRNDNRTLSALVAALSQPNVGSLEVEVARAMADPSLCAPLEALQSWWDVDPELLERAISACRTKDREDEKPS